MEVDRGKLFEHAKSELDLTSRRRPPRPRPCSRSPSAWPCPTGGGREPGQPPAPELRQRQAVRRIASLVILAGVGMLVLIGAFYLFQNQRLADAKDDLAAQNDMTRAPGADRHLQQYADLQGSWPARSGSSRPCTSTRCRGRARFSTSPA